MATNRKKIEFKTNVWQELALQFPTGKPMPDNGYGPSMMFTTTADEVLFVPLPIGERIEAFQLSKGEPIQIAKVEQTNGQRKFINWEVKRVFPASNPSTVCVSEREEVGSLQGKQSGPQQSAQTEQHQHTDSLIKPLVGAQMRKCGIAAIDILLDIQQHANNRGMALTFNEEDVRTMTTSMFIATMRDGGKL